MLMSWLGHRDSKMIRHYYHLRPEEARKQMAKLRLLDDTRTVSDEPGSLET